MFGERVPEGGGSCREGSVAPGSVLGPGWWSQKVCVRWAEAAGWIVAMEEVSEVGRGLVMEGFVCKEEDFWTECAVELGASGGSRGQGWFDHRCGCGWVDSGGDEAVDECFSSREGEWWAESGNVVEMKEGSSGDLVYVMFKGEVIVKDDSEVATGIWGP